MSDSSSGGNAFTYDDTNFQTLVRHIRSRMGNTQPVTEIMGEIVQASIFRNFEEGGRPTPWPDLKESTKAQRRRKGKWPGQILVVEGVRNGLMGSVTYQAMDDKVVWSANKIYSAIHHFGGMAGPGRKVEIPARPYMMIQDEDWEEMKDALSTFLLEVS